MKKISISRDFGVYDIGKTREIESLIQRINIEGSNEVEFDLKDCFIDYPATGKLIDSILIQLSETTTAPRKILIKYDCNLPEGTLLNWLFLGSDFFQIENEKELPLDKLKGIIEKRIREYNIRMELLITTTNDESLNSFVYE